jgi:insulin-like growth factor 1 receptor
MLRLCIILIILTNFSMILTIAGSSLNSSYLSSSSQLLSQSSSNYDFVVCASVRIRGIVQYKYIQKLQRCSIILGNIQIVNADFSILSDNKQKTVFKNLIEITDYLLIFQVKGLKSLENIFPKLKIIRGDHLFKNSFSFIIFLTNSLYDIAIPNLMKIQNGNLLLSRLYHTCYINTINWKSLINDKQQSINKFLINDNCFGEKCPNDCKHCWNSNKCQLKCNNNTCLGLCSKYRDLKTGQCVEKCVNNDQLAYNHHTCIPADTCGNTNQIMNNKFSLYNNFNQSDCIEKCPNGYKSQLSAETGRRFCLKCTGSICQRNCANLSVTIRFEHDLALVKDCYKIKSLRIELRSNVTEEQLELSLKYLKEITNYLLILQNKYLISLGFFESLKRINGDELYDKKYSLVVNNNEKLKELWWKEPLIIEKGSVKFFENPLLCLETIEQFLKVNSFQTVNSINLNGYQRLTCSNKTIELKFKKFIDNPRLIHLSWNITMADTRRLKGFIVSYTKMSNSNTIYNLNDQIDFDSFESTWQHLYIQQQNSTKEVEVEISLEPFTHYAFYVKADVTFKPYYNNSYYSTFKNDRVVSDINYILTNPARNFKILIFIH